MRLQGQPRRIGSIATGPDGTFAFGSVYLDENTPAGLYFADLHRMQWSVCTCEAWGERSYNCHSVPFHPNGKTLLAAVEPDGTTSTTSITHCSGPTTTSRLRAPVFTPRVSPAATPAFA
jgi:hypothetical protein